jgi:uncharacterized protein (TIGR01777 family)
MADTKRIVVTGATGLIGKAVCKRLVARGDQVVVFSRDPQKARAATPGAAEYVAWTPAEQGPWATAVDGADAVIHLAGASIAGKRWDEAYKREIRDSRVLGTRGIVNTLRQAKVKPKVLVSGSAVGYYGPRDDTKLDEAAAPGRDFLASVCVEWEREAARATELGVRTALIRTGIVLDKREGALAQLLLPFSLFAGGPVLPGTQWWPWIHLADEVGIILFALDDERVSGPINATAPTPETNRAFSAALGRAMGRPSWAPLPGFALRIMLGEMADALLIAGQRVVPAKAESLGYKFQFTDAEQAMRAILQ